ncbi:hypothetical protein ACFYMO_00730 [Streptomyces sp. NPDC007025]|uniref:hypothetical protein n=1 Tax=Streptomyces sp. NPDC007025 TaxID=3364771 RepID=UPI003692A091
MPDTDILALQATINRLYERLMLVGQTLLPLPPQPSGLAGETVCPGVHEDVAGDGCPYCEAAV